jgi:hypothetical protein
MTSTYKQPFDLADVLCKELRQRKLLCPALEQVVTIFETLYFASLKTEEGQSISCHIIYLDPANPDPKPPEIIVNDRWSYVPFVKPVQFSVSDLVKIARASDPRTSSFVVFPNQSGQLHIWGLVDQGNRYYDFLNYESESGPERPGLFQASILGVGYLVAYLGYERIAELRIGTLINRTSDVLRKGPIRLQLQPAISEFVAAVKNALPDGIFEKRSHWTSSLEDDWITVLCRLLLRARNYRHGGAYLITPDTSEKGLNVKYRIDYQRLAIALFKKSLLQVRSTDADDLIFENYMLKDNQPIPLDLYLRKEVDEANLLNSLSEIDGSIWFVSLLSRVDGLVLLHPDLSVHGFGVEITFANELDSVYIASGPLGGPKGLRRVDYHQYGTRHRSMMRYCANADNSIGFVVSQDGDVRAITKLDDKVVIWENIRLQFDDFVTSLRNKNLTSK